MSGDPYRDLIREAKRQGWVVATTGSGHLRLTSPTGHIIVAARTPSDKRATLNLRARLRQRGVKC